MTDPIATGAVTLSLPQDVQAEAYDYPENFFNKRVWNIPRSVPSENTIIAAANIIKKSSTPVIIAGGGVLFSDAEKSLSKFCNHTGIPVVETQAGKGAIPWDHDQ